MSEQALMVAEPVDPVEQHLLRVLENLQAHRVAALAAELEKVRSQEAIHRVYLERVRTELGRAGHGCDCGGSPIQPHAKVRELAAERDSLADRLRTAEAENRRLRTALEKITQAKPFGVGDYGLGIEDGLRVTATIARAALAEEREGEQG